MCANDRESLTVWYTSKLGWNNVESRYEKVGLEDVSVAHYISSEGFQRLSWQKENWNM